MVRSSFSKPRTSVRAGLRLGVVFIAVAATLVGCSSAAAPNASPRPKPSGSIDVPSTSSTDALVAAAQKEGGLNLYSAAVPNALALLAGAFTGMYNIPVNVTRLVSVPLQTQFTAEVEAGKPVADIVQMSDSDWMSKTATADQWFETPDPADVPSVAKWPKNYILGGQAYLQSLGLYDIAYNSDVVTGKDIPKTWKDVLDKKWQGKIMLVDPRSNNAQLAWMYEMDKLYGDDFLKKLGALKPQYSLSTAVGINSVASGDAAMIVPTNHWSNTPLIAAGAPIVDTYPSPTTSAEEWMAMVKNSPHPAAAKLFLNFALSPYGQLAMCKDLCTSVLNVPGTIPFPAKYISPPITEAVADRAHLLALLGLK